MRRAILAAAVVVVTAAAPAFAQPGADADAPAGPAGPPPVTPLPADAPESTPTPGTAAARPVAFEQVIALALAHAADARVAADEVQRADALLAESVSTLRPLLGISAQYQQLEGDRFSHGTETAAGESFLGELTLSMPLLDFRKRADTQRARDQLEVERANEQTTRRAVAIAAGRAYLSVFAAERIIEVAQLSVATARAHVEFATHRTQGGIGTELDIVRAQAELATDEAQLATARTALVQAQEALGVLVGGSVPLGSTAEPAFPDAPDLPDLHARADIAAGDRRLQSAQWSRDAQWAEYAPTLSVNGVGFYDTPQLEPIPAWGFQVLAVVAVPLYDGGYRGGLAHERDAVLDESREELAQLERTASSEVRAGRDAVRRAREARAAAHRSADFATRALQLANIAYQGGTGTSLDVIDAERTARDAATQAVISDDGLRQAQFALLAATGRFP